jgi:RNA polymerase sigma factor (sigma-70 family)
VNLSTDQQLLRDYAEHRSEAAFTELVRRHIDFVYSTALRMVRDAHLAGDVSQGVFVALANTTGQLADCPALEGWLHGTTRNLAANAVRAEVRRRNREQEAAIMNEILSPGDDVSWEYIAPHLDEALGELSPPERDALLLRYFKNYDFRAVGLALGVSDDAAQKRVSRAVEKLHEFFSKRKTTIGAGSLGILISANAVQAAPVGLATTISATVLAGTAVTASIITTATKTIAMTTLQKTLITTTVALLAGAGIYEARQAHDARVEAQKLRDQQTPLSDRVQQLQNSLASASNQITGMLVENSRLKSSPQEMELLKLRGEAGVLKSFTEENDNLRRTEQELQNKLNQALQRTNETKLPEDIIPPGQMYFSDTDIGNVLEKYRNLNWQDVQVYETPVNFARMQARLTFTNTNSMTRAEAVAALEQVFQEQARIEISHPDTNHAILKLR